MNLLAVLRNRLHRYLRRLTGRHRDNSGLHAGRQMIKKAVKKSSISLLTVIIITCLFLFVLGLVFLVIFTSPTGGHNHHLLREAQRRDHHLHIEPKDPVVIVENLEPDSLMNKKPSKPELNLQIESVIPNLEPHNDHQKTTENIVIDVLALGRVTSDADRAERNSGFSKHAFNTLISDRLGVRRPLPDTRHELCKSQHYENLINNATDKENKKEKHRLLTTSVIICFHNEHFSTLQRTVYSVLERTPRHLLKEVILVDDHSNETLVQHLAKYIEEQSVSDPSGDYFTKVHYYRVPERAGLIRARLYGTRFADGEVLLFLDSHCEVNTGWLEPLLDRITQNRKTIACPIIDLIDPDTFQYRPSPLVKGGFNWGLHFKWDSIEDLHKPENFIRPVASPTMAGGLFAIERNYFHELGEYDDGMKIWGGENLELSFRVWMCGGRLEIVPCSRVGHIFRKRRPYNGNGDDKNMDTLAYNSLRVAYVWMDDYKKYFLSSRTDLSTMEYGDIQPRLDLRHRKLNCSNFEWYLKNIYPELQTPEQAAQSAAEQKEKDSLPKNLFKPATPPKTVSTFLLQLDGTKFCMQSESDSTYKQNQGQTLSMALCSKTARLQRWRRTEVEDIRIGPKTCLAVSNDHRLKVSLGKCHQQGGTQLWRIEQENESSTAQLYNPGSGLCLGVVIKTDEKGLKHKNLESLVGNESLKPKMAASFLQLKMSFCKLTKTNITNSDIHEQQQPQYTNWKMQVI